jgi:hypothetical protein
VPLSSLPIFDPLSPPYPPPPRTPIYISTDITGGCERILRTPIYLPYTRNTNRFMLMWLAGVPIGQQYVLKNSLLKNALTCL